MMHNFDIRSKLHRITEFFLAIGLIVVFIFFVGGAILEGYYKIKDSKTIVCYRAGKKILETPVYGLYAIRENRTWFEKDGNIIKVWAECRIKPE